MNLEFFSNLISVASMAVIAVVCTLAIIKYHRSFGLLVTLTLFAFLLATVGVFGDELDGERTTGAIPIFRFLLAITSVYIYAKFKHFWELYGTIVLALDKPNH